MNTASEQKMMAPDDWIACLKDPAAYPHRPDAVTVIQTHISYVAIAPPYVYKIKKPVDLGFVDFTDVQKRRHFCRREVELNRRLCRNIYEDVVPVSVKADGLAIEDQTRTIEYAVKMKQLAADGFLSNRLENEFISREDIDRIVDLLCEFYRAQSPHPDVAEAGYSHNIHAVIKENFDQTERFINDLIADYVFDAIRYYNHQFFCRYTPLLNRRRVEGRFLDCHGDLRAEHIHLSPDAVRVFDCIEFNDQFRHIDVANEAAFLAMDFDSYGRDDLAGYFARHMAESLNDPTLLKVLDFYKCYRAYVRAKVHSLKSIEPDVPAEEQNVSRRKALHLYRLSLRYAVCGSAPMALVLTGRIGTGKSTLAKYLAEALDWDVLDSDVIRKQLAGIPLTLRPEQAVRERMYASEMTDKTYAALLEQALEHVRAGKSCVVDAVFGSPERRVRFRDVLESEPVRYCFVELTAADATVIKRLRERETEAAVISDARLEDYQKLNAGYHRPDALEQSRFIQTWTDRPLSGTLADILKDIIRLEPLNT